MEVLPILYSNNTLYISSMPLLQRLTSAFSPTTLSLITSLHLNFELWPEDCPHELQGLQPVNRIKRFSIYSRIISQFAPGKFPALKKLGIEFTSDWHSDGWDLFTRNVAKVIPGKSGGIYLLEPTDKIVDAFNRKLDLQLILKPEHAFVISHKLGLSTSVIRGVHPSTNLQYWKIWRDKPASSKTEGAGWPGQGYWIHWDPYFQLPVGDERETPGPYADKWWHVHSSQPWSFWTDGNGFVYRRPVAELRLDWGIEADGGSGPWGMDAAAAREERERDRRVWYSEEEVEWSPLSWLRERAA